MFKKGYKQTEGHKGKLSKAHLGKKFSVEHRKAISEALKRNGVRPKEPFRWTGKKRDEAFKHSISILRKGKKHTDEAKAKISKAGKGRLAWNKGSVGIYSKETLKKMSESRKGKKASDDTKKRISQSKTGTHWKVKNTSKNREAQTGKKLSEETKRKIGDARRGIRRPEISGENSPHWKGGISKNPYPLEFNTKLRKEVRARDNYTCCLCGRTEREELEEFNRILSVNHIDFDKNHNKINNLNTLCVRCNTKINREREYWTDYFNTQII